MQSVSDDKMAVALAKNGGMSFIYGSQTIEEQAEMVRKVKKYKAGFVISDSNLTPDNTLEDVLNLLNRTGHSTMAVTADGTPNGKLLGIVTARDYRTSRDELTKKVAEFMTPYERLIVGKEGTTLKAANDIIWEHKLNSLPIIDKEGNLQYLVFRKDYAEDKENSRALLDSEKRYMVGAGINSRDYAERVPALVEAGVDAVCIDSSEGFSEWQYDTIKWVRDTYGDSVKIGAGNVVDREGFRYLADAGADFIKTSTGKVPVNATPETVYVICEALRQFHAQTGKMVGIKVAGGITKIQNAIRYLTIVKHILGEQWLTPAYFRIGTSQLLEDVLKEMKTVKING